MKKIIFSMLMMLVCSVAMGGKNPVVLESGSLADLANPAKTVYFTTDFTNATVHNDGKDYTLDGYLKHRGEDFVADWNKDKDTAYSYIPVRFNQKNKKGAQALMAKGDHDILGTIYLTSIDFGNGAGSFNPFGGVKAGGCIISGKIVFTDSNKNEIASLPFTDIKGMGHISETIRLGLSYYELMGKLGDVMKEESKKKK